MVSLDKWMYLFGAFIWILSGVEGKGCSDFCSEESNCSRVCPFLKKPPRVNLGGLGSTSLSLSWETPYSSAVDWVLEVRRDNERGYSTINGIRSNGSQWSVKDLIPFTRYRFRFVGYYRGKQRIGNSQESLIVTTRPEGRPSSPRLVVVSQINSLHINVTWLPPSSPRNRIIAYKLRINETPQKEGNYRATQDIPVKDEDGNVERLYHAYLSGPPPSTNREKLETKYNVTLTAVNVNGEEGEEAFQIIVIPTSPFDGESQMVLLFAEGRSLYRKILKHSNDFFSVHKKIATLQNHIISISGAVKRKEIILTDSHGDLFIVRNIMEEKEEVVIISENERGLKASETDVDWLYEKIYVLDKKRRNIYRCEVPTFDVPKLRGCSRLPFSVFGTITHLKVDSYNGFLYWIENGSWLWAGSLDGKNIFRIGSKGSYATFVISPRESALILPDINSNKLYSVDVLNEKRVLKRIHEDYRGSAEAYYSGIHKLVRNGTSSLFWSSSEGLNVETFDPNHGYSSLVIEYGLRITALFTYSIREQPIPYPLNPVTNLRVLFLAEQKTLVRWSRPTEPTTLGGGAWRKWKYHLKVFNLKDKSQIEKTSVCCEYELLDLQPGVLYRFSVRAFVNEDSGRNNVGWSLPWTGKTIDKNYDSHNLIWATHSSIKISNYIIPGSQVNTSLLNHKIQIIEISNAFGLSDEGKIYKLPFLQPIPLSIEDIRSLAFDPLGNRLYISIPYKRTISRIRMKDMKEEVLVKGVAAKTIVISSSGGIMCWILYTERSLKCSNLNGDDIVEIFSIEMWRDHRILSLTTTENDGIYFMTFAGSSLEYRIYFRSNVLSSRTSAKLIKSFDFYRYRFLQSGMLFLSDKIMWISNETRLLIYDTLGDSQTEIPLSEPVTAFSIKNSRKEKSLSDPTVPSESELTIDGKREEFFIRWKSAENVEYVVLIDDKVVTISRQSFVKIINPELKDSFNLSLYSRTKRAFSDTLYARISPPESTPDPPKNIRAFLVGNRVTLRWDAPAKSNGLLRNYELTLHPGEVHISVPPNVTEYVATTNAPISVIDVRSVNGYGKSSDTHASVFPFEVPQVIFKDESGDYYLLDADKGSKTSLMKDVSFYEYLNEEEEVFVIGKRIYHRHKGYKTRILYSSDQAIQLFAFDWIGRYIIWSSDGKMFRRISIDESNVTGNVFTMFNLTDEVIKIALSFSGRPYVLTVTGEIYNFKSKDTLVKLSNDTCGVEKGHYSLTNFFIENDETTISTILDLSIMIRSCVRYVGYRDLITFPNYEFWIPSGVNEVKSSFRSGFTSGTLKPKPQSLTQIFSPITRRHYLETELKECFVISIQDGIKILNVTYSSVEILLPEVNYPGCKGKYIFDPSTIYDISINSSLDVDRKLKYVNAANSLNRTLTVSGLKSFTPYNVTLRAYNHYNAGLNLLAEVHTKEGIPSPPRNLTVRVVTPTAIHLSWNPPEVLNGKSVDYRIHYSGSSLIQIRRFEEKTKGLEYILKGLNPDTSYSVWISAIPISSTTDVGSESKKVTLRTYKLPELVGVVDKGARSLKLSWKSPPSCTHVVFHKIIIYPKSNPEHKITIPSLSRFGQRTQPSQIYIHEIDDGLWPGTKYVLKVQLFFGDYGPKTPTEDIEESSLYSFVWPFEDNDRVVETLLDIPLAPGPPYILENFTHSTVGLTWNERDKNVLLYELFAKQIISSSIVNETNANESIWFSVYSDTDSFWPLSALEEAEYLFKVRAKNRVGWSDFSLQSQVVNVASAFARFKASLPTNMAIVGGSICGFIFLCLMTFVLALTLGKRSWKEKKPSKDENDHFRTGSDHELATLSHLPIRHGRVDANNPLYNWIDGCTEEEMSSIKHFHQSQLTFGKILGSGAFGKVYEGTIRCEEFGQRSVALKTLKCDAKDVTKKEFLKEALVMSKFNHPNILRLIGARLDEDPVILIMELMETDLLEFLRSRRSGGRSAVTGENLMRICLDVARGCSYLAQMRHVHRDIAARNCLVSSPTSDNTRVVKIGDFGMARDIYKNDYYRKGGLMPVRWMAPESLEDGVYTHQTDVWAFGVLLWEIVTLGRQPYPAMSHTEVIRYVLNRGHLERPPKCPDLLYQLQVHCWAYEPQDRPTFKDCVDAVEELLLYSDELNAISFNRSSSSGGVAGVVTASAVNSAHNEAVMANGNSRDSWKTSGRSQSTTISVPRSPRYLELLDDNAGELESASRRSIVDTSSGFSTFRPQGTRTACSTEEPLRNVVLNSV